MKALGVVPIKVTFDSAIQVYSHIGDVAGAMRWLSAMLLCGCNPDEVTFRWFVIITCIKCNVTNLLFMQV